MTRELPPDKAKYFQDFIETAGKLKTGKLTQADIDDSIEVKSRELERNTGNLARTVYANYQSFRLILNRNILRRKFGIYPVLYIYIFIVVATTHINAMSFDVSRIKEAIRLTRGYLYRVDDEMCSRSTEISTKFHRKNRLQVCVIVYN